MPVQFQNFTVQVTEAMEKACIAWLYETSGSIASEAAQKCTMTDQSDGIALDASYDRRVNEGKLEAVVGTPMEAGYWEEFGTGEYADTAKNGGKQGREGWWVYVKDGPAGDGGETYATEKEAKAVAESMRKAGLDAYHTNGRQPNYTLEKAFKRVEGPARNRLNELLREGLNE